jgi:GTP-binding protein Era
MKEYNIDTLIEITKNYLKDNVKYYEDEVITNTNPEFMITELVREKILNLTNDEVPHSVTCVLSSFNNKASIAEIGVDIIVSRDNLKKIIIGKSGAMLKEIGTEARKDIEHLLNKQVYLELYVKTVKDWRNNVRYIDELYENQ